MTTTTRLAAITTDRFVATDHGNFWFVADTHALGANGTVRVKDKAQAKRWTEDVLGSEIEWDGYLSESGFSRDGAYKIVRLGPTKTESARWEITLPNESDREPAYAVSPRAAQLYIRERKLWWVDQPLNLGLGSEVAMQDPETGFYRAEVVTEAIAWADNSDEIRGHLGGRRMLSYPSGDACF
jgi:hypothetical protein